jgi:hypothetical protein
MQCDFKSINSNYGVLFDGDDLEGFWFYQIAPQSGLCQICLYQKGQMIILNANFLRMQLKPNTQYKLQVHYLLASENVVTLQCYLDSILTNQYSYIKTSNYFYRSVGFLVSEAKIVIENLHIQTIEPDRVHVDTTHPNLVVNQFGLENKNIVEDNNEEFEEDNEEDKWEDDEEEEDEEANGEIEVDKDQARFARNAKFSELSRIIFSAMAGGKEEEDDFLRCSDRFEKMLYVEAKPPYKIRRDPTALKIKALIKLSSVCYSISMHPEKILVSDDGEFVLILYEKSCLIWNIVLDEKEVYFESKIKLSDACFLNNEEYLLFDEKGILRIFRISDSQLRISVDLHIIGRGALDVSPDKHELSINTGKKIYIVDLVDLSKKELKVGGRNIQISSCNFSSDPNSIIYTWEDPHKLDYMVCLFDHVNKRKIFNKNRGSFNIISEQVRSIERNAFLYKNSFRNSDENFNPTRVDGLEYYNLDTQNLNFWAFLSGRIDEFTFNTSILGIDTNGSQVILRVEFLDSSVGLLAILDIANGLVTIHPTSGDIDRIVKFPDSRKFIYSSSELFYLANMDL